RRVGGVEAWSGEVELIGVCVVAKGAVLRLAPGCRIAAPAGFPPPQFVVQGMLVVEGTRRRPLTLDASVAAAGGLVLLSNCRLDGRGGEGLHLYGDGHRLDRVELSGFETGLFLRDGSVEARRLAVSGCARAITVASGGRLRLEGTCFRGCAQGLALRGGDAEIDGLDCLGLSGAAVELLSTGFASLRGVRAPGGDALVAAAGHAHLSGPVEGRVRASPPAEFCVASGAVRRVPLGSLRGFVLATGRRAVWGGAYRGAAAASVRLFSAWARLQPGVAGAWAHRSWVSGGWEPGASDIDLALSVRELSSPGAKRWLTRAQALHAGARRLFPALGELLIAEEAEWRECAASGLPRPGEWRAQARVLAGRLPGYREPVPVAARAGARLEAAMAYTRLMDVCVHPERAEELARRDAAKAVVDLLRYRTDAGEGGRALSREEFRASLASSSPEWAERLRELDAPGRAHKTACSLAAAAARRWAGPVNATRPPSRERVPLERASGEMRHALEAIDAARRDFGGAVSAAVFDTLHRSFLVVEPDLPEDAFAEGLAAWSRRGAACGERLPLPIVLTPRGWELWRATAYQDFPSSSAAWPRPGEAALQTAGRAFDGECRLFWGEFNSPPPDADESAAALAQGRAQFRAIRRFLALEARSSRAAAHHLL
ncbi:MAG TPA: hypothetical protein VH309_14235, partial [Elusimicrobiota bacterium]|nr:hypothetical protein [Elusimicrobiota bacterium]